MEHDASFGSWLTDRRKALSISRAELARRCACATVTLRKIEEDARRPSAELAAILADRLIIPADHRDTFVRVARGERRVDALPPARLLPSAAPHAHRAVLPTPPTPLVGRDADVAAVATLLRTGATRLVTLLGPPGIGKTRLGLAVAHLLRDTFADGACFVALAPLTDPAHVLPAIAQALGLVEDASTTLIARLSAGLRDRHLLLVLDNCELLVAAAPELAELLAAAPRLHILATSRVALRLSGEQRSTVPPLQLPSADQAPALIRQTAAVELFVQRARATLPSFSPTDSDMQDVAAICRRLDGVPLAIELAAARVILFSLGELLTQLDSRLALLSIGAADLPVRQQTLRGAIAWSYQLLTPEVCRLFCWLGVFVGGWTLAAAEAVCLDAGHSVREGLAHLVDHSLVQRAEQPDGTPRFSMLETIREYALEQLEASGAMHTARRQHVEAFLARAEQAIAQPSAVYQLIWLDQLEQDHDNMRAALAWALDHDPGAARQLSVALFDFWYTRGHRTEGRRWIEQALRRGDVGIRGHAASALAAEAGARASAVVWAKALHRAGSFAHAQDDHVRAVELFDESLALARRLDDIALIAQLLLELGEIAYDQNEQEKARLLSAEGLALARASGDAHIVAAFLRLCGDMAELQADRAQTIAYAEERLAIYRALDDQRGVARALRDLGVLAHEQGDMRRAAERYAEGLRLARMIGDQGNIMWLLYHAGRIAFEHHDLRTATACFVESAELCDRLGYREGIALNLVGLAAIASEQHDLLQATHYLGAAEAHAEPSSWLQADARADFERVRHLAHTQLDGATFAAARAAGHGMLLLQTLTLARMVVAPRREG